MGLLRTKVYLKGQLQVLAEVKNIILEAKINLLTYVDKTAIEMKNLLGNHHSLTRITMIIPWEWE